MMTLLAILVMLFGFGFVVFWHELGHFIGARRAGIRVEQFAVGMGQAIVAYRRGLGVRLMGFGKAGWHWGDTLAEYEQRTTAYLTEKQELPGGDDGQFTEYQRGEAAKAMGISETEYRLSWLPIGGYVKPTGQDDLRPQSVAAKDDPYCYAAAPVGKRMVLIGAGVVMNVILAGMLFFVLFRFVGFKSIKSEVGEVQSNSPAAEAGARGGDELLELHGNTLHDFTKILMNVALLPSYEPVDLRIKRDGAEQTLHVQPRPTLDNNKMLALGIQPAPLLRTADPAKLTDEDRREWPKDATLQPGEQIVAIAGQPVGDADYARLAAAVQASYGHPFEVTKQDAAKQRTDVEVTPHFSPVFNRGTLAFAGMTPRTRIGEIDEKSTAKDKLAKGDVILSIRVGAEGSLVRLPTVAKVIETVQAADKAGTDVTLQVDRDGKTLDVSDLRPTVKIPGRGQGLGVGLEADASHATIGEVAPASPSALAGLPEGATIISVDGQAVSTWGDVHRAMLASREPRKIELKTVGERGDEAFAVALSAADIGHLATIRYANPIEMLEPAPVLRKTESALSAVGWGVTETRDLILQGYLTLRRVVTGSVPASGMSGPVGIFTAGVGFFQRGPDWFLWFLALISANLAVVNFLPVPILDGWHFLGLVKEKITGKPLSERVQAKAQWVGLAMILGLLLFVTFNDVMRLLP